MTFYETATGTILKGYPTAATPIVAAMTLNQGLYGGLVGTLLGMMAYILQPQAVRMITTSVTRCSWRYIQ